MSTMSSHDVAGLDEHHFERWHRLQEDRRFRVEQLAALAAQPPGGHRRASVDEALRIAATSILGEIDAALARMDAGCYGTCVACGEFLPAHRLDTLPMAPLCMPCHYTEQNGRAGNPDPGDQQPLG